MKKLVLILLMLVHGIACAKLETPATTPIKVVIPYNAGGGVDAVFRLMQQYAESNKMVIFPEYRPGATGQVGINQFSNAAPDGKTIMLTINSDVSRSPVRNRVYPASAIADSIFVVVTSPVSKITNITQLTNILKKDPSRLNWGVGSQVLHNLSDRMANELVQSKIKITTIPYQGAGKVIPNLVGGHIDIAVVPRASVATLIDSGQLTQLAVWNNTEAVQNCYNFPKILDGELISDGYGIFLPAASSEETKRFWITFAAGFTRDLKSRKLLNSRDMVVLQDGPENIRKIIERNL